MVSFSSAALIYNLRSTSEICMSDAFTDTVTPISPGEGSTTTSNSSVPSTIKSSTMNTVTLCEVSIGENTITPSPTNAKSPSGENKTVYYLVACDVGACMPGNPMFPVQQYIFQALC